jgi:hypothetical protein
MWTAARKRLPTLSSALKFTGGMLVFDLLWFNLKGRDSAPWVGDMKKKTWSSDFDKKDPTKTYETYFRSDPERPHLRYPVGVIRSKPDAREKARRPASRFQPIHSDEIDVTREGAATWDPWSVPSL